MAIDLTHITLLRSVELAAGREFGYTQSWDPQRPKHRVSMSAAFGKPLAGSSEPIFFLSLYSDAFFIVKESLSIDPHWKVTKRRISSQAKVSNSEQYQIINDAWPRFESFIRMCEKARTHKWTPMEVAKRHYLTATFAPEDSLAQWEPLASITSGLLTFENILFHYVFAIEALLSPGSEDKSIIEGKSMVVDHAKDLAGRNNDERNWIKDFVKRAYKIRNAFAHGSEIDSQHLSFDLLKLRRLTQRIICLALGMFVYTDSATAGAALKHMDGQLAQKRAATVRKEVYKLIQNDSPFTGAINIETS